MLCSAPVSSTVQSCHCNCVVVEEEYSTSRRCGILFRFVYVAVGVCHVSLVSQFGHVCDLAGVVYVCCHIYELL